MDTRGFLAIAVLGVVALAERASGAENLALASSATASEQQGELAPQKAIDGDANTRWSGIPGHNEGVWFQLDWKSAVTIAEVVVHQFDRYVMQADVAAWDEAASDWKTVLHLGAQDHRLPKIVFARFAPVTTTKLRIGNITNGPSFTEVEVYAAPFSAGITTAVAGDLQGHLVGMVTDSYGAEGISGAKVRIKGEIARGDEDDTRARPWSAEATSDPDGQFEVALPLGLDGDLEITTRVGEVTARSQVDASSIQTGLTPRDATNTQPLPVKGDWRFMGDPPVGFERPEFDDSGWETIEVPSHWAMAGFDPKGGIGGYRAHVQIDEARPQQPAERVILAFDGVYSGASVYLNGKLVAVHEGGATPFECDVTNVAHGGDNVLALRVAEHTATSDTLDQMSAYADFPLAGIIRSVWLLHLPALHIGGLALESVIGGEPSDVRLRGTVTVENRSPRSYLGAIEIVASPRGSAVPLKPSSLSVYSVGPWDRAVVPIDWAVGSPSLWTAEDPNLYTLTLALNSGAEGRGTVQQLTQAFGFRQTTIRGAEILINGKPVKFKGTCHHDSHPLLGRAVTPELERLDLEMMKEANLNALRTSHYPPLPELLGIADELGLYVEDEASFCWVSVSDDLRLAPRIRQLTSELIARDRNHPSVFMWSLCNESGFGRGFELAHEAVKKLDPSRPCGAATSATLDIATAHNPITVARIEENEHLDRPLLFDESFAPFQGIWGDAGEDFLDPGVRDAYVTPLPAIYTAMMTSHVTQGSMIWAWSDDIFCVRNRGVEFGRQGTRSDFIANTYTLPGRGRAGDAPWGLVDGWRRKKPEFFHVKKLHSPIRISATSLPLPSPGEPIRVAVTNEFDFTDLSMLTVDWAIGDQKGRAALSHEAGSSSESIPAHATGTVLLRLESDVGIGDVVELTFRDREARVIDSFRLPLGERSVPAPNLEEGGDAALTIEEENSLAGRATRIRGESFEIAVDRDSGRLRRAVAFSEPILVELPTLHVLASGKPFQEIPDRTSWRVSAVSVEKAGDGALIRIAGAYDAFDGAYEFAVTPGGELRGRARFTYRGSTEIVAREIGWRLAGPQTLDRISWSRRAEWSAYPGDHIGRPIGVARADYAHPFGEPPSWPWAEDASAFGSNDFRSTKRNIDWAILSCPAGAAIHVMGEGRQHVRACRESDRVALFVNDEYGGTGAGLWEWVSNYGRGRSIAPGESIETTLHFALRRVAH